MFAEALKSGKRKFIVVKVSKEIDKHPWVLLWIYMIITGVLYETVSVVQIYPPFIIYPTWVDNVIPVIPFTAYIYLSYFLLVPSFVIWFKNDPEFVKMFVSVFICVIINLSINFIFPTQLIPGRETGLPEGSLLQLIRLNDRLTCAFPSGHITLPTFLFMLTLGTRFSYIYLLWTFVLAFATLTTKQHYLPDVLGGLVLGLILGWIAKRKLGKISTMNKKPYIHWPAIRAILCEYLVITFCMAATLSYWKIYTIIPCIFIIATRQHALLIIYHDSVHFLISRNKRLNDFITNFFMGVPMILPVHFYRSLHLAHHKNLGTEKDPERILLYRGQTWNYRPLPFFSLIFQLLGDLLMINNLKTILYFLREKNDPESKLELSKSKYYPELFLNFLLLAFIIGLLFFYQPVILGRLCILWLIPLYSVTQLLQKIRSFAEHTGQPEEKMSGSWKPGIWARLTIWPYNINYHREHHHQPGIPWDELPVQFPKVNQQPASELLYYLWNGKAF